VEFALEGPDHESRRIQANQLAVPASKRLPESCSPE